VAIEKKVKTWNNYNKKEKRADRQSYSEIKEKNRFFLCISLDLHFLFASREGSQRVWRCNLTLERTKKNMFSFGSLLAYSYLFPSEKVGGISEKPK
jgi:hypothetical protein